MAPNRATNFDEFEAELLKKPGIHKEYEALKPKYDVIRSLIKRRSKLGISQKELAQIIGTKQPAISRLEKGDYNTTLRTFFKVADALDLDVSLKTRKTGKPNAAKVATLNKKPSLAAKIRQEIRHLHTEGNVCKSSIAHQYMKN